MLHSSENDELKVELKFQFTFEVLTTTRPRSCKSFILCLCMKTFRAKKAEVPLANFLQRHQLEIISKQNLTQSSIFM